MAGVAGDDPTGSSYWLHGARMDQGSSSTTDGYGNYGGSVWSPAQALSDPNSDASNALYYGGSAGAASSDINRAQALGAAAQSRVGPQVDTTQSDQSRAMLTGLGGQLSSLAAGNPNSVAQQQLAQGYGAANANAQSMAASARGGPIAAALAQRGAQHQIADNAQNQAAGANTLMNQEQMGAYGQLGALGGAMGSNDASQAFGQANLDAQQRARNDAMQANYESQAQQTAGQAMVGQQNRMGARQNWLGVDYGQANAQAAMTHAADAANVNTALGVSSSGTAAAGRIMNSPAQQASTTPSAPTANMTAAQADNAAAANRNPNDPDKNTFSWSG